jgi:hypothetical protein
MPDKEKHTPGPWKVGVTLSDGRRIALVLKGTDMRGKHNVYRDVHATRHHIEEQEPVANARLIAAAPDLLAACKALKKATSPEKDSVDFCREALRASGIARHAIAKARGLGDASDSDMPDQDERDAVGLTSAGKEVAELRDEKERLKERIAELEKTLRIVGESLNQWTKIVEKSFSVDLNDIREIIRSAIPDENATQSVSHEAEVDE